MNDFTVGDLRQQLEGLEDNVSVSFSGGLTFYRLKRWGDNEVIVEFGEPLAFQSDSFKKRNPNVKAAFIRVDNVEWDESGIVGGSVNVEVT